MTGKLEADNNYTRRLLDQESRSTTIGSLQAIPIPKETTTDSEISPNTRSKSCCPPLSKVAPAVAFLTECLLAGVTIKDAWEREIFPRPIIIAALALIMSSAIYVKQSALNEDLDKGVRTVYWPDITKLSLSSLGLTAGGTLLRLATTGTDTSNVIKALVLGAGTFMEEFTEAYNGQRGSVGAYATYVYSLPIGFSRLLAVGSAGAMWTEASAGKHFSDKTGEPNSIVCADPGLACLREISYNKAALAVISLASVFFASTAAVFSISLLRAADPMAGDCIKKLAEGVSERPKSFAFVNALGHAAVIIMALAPAIGTQFQGFSDAPQALAIMTTLAILAVSVVEYRKARAVGTRVKNANLSRHGERHIDGPVDIHPDGLEDSRAEKSEQIRTVSSSSFFATTAEKVIVVDNKEATNGHDLTFS